MVGADAHLGGEAAPARAVFHRDLKTTYKTRDGLCPRDLCVMDAYDAFMRWHKPLRTGSVFVVFVSICLFLDAEYAGLVPVTLVALGLLVLGRRRFLRGYPRASFLDEAFEKADAELLNGATQRFRPCGRLKIAMCAGRGFEKDDDVYAVATFRRPLLDEPVVEKPRPRSGSASPRIAEALSVDTSLDALLDDAQAMPTPGAAQGTKARGDSIMLDDAPLPVSPCVEINQCVRCNFDFHAGVTDNHQGRRGRNHASRNFIRIHGHVSRPGPTLARVLGGDGRPGSRVVLDPVEYLLCSGTTTTPLRVSSNRGNGEAGARTTRPRPSTGVSCTLCPNRWTRNKCWPGPRRRAA